MEPEYLPQNISEDYIETYFESKRLPAITTINGFKYMFNDAKCEIDDWLKRRLNRDLIALANGWDLIFAISGMEGSGKTKGLGLTICSYIAWRLHKPFGLKDIVFTSKQFVDRIENAKRGDVILWDEFVFGGSAEDTMTNVQKTLKKMFTVIRSKRLVIGLILPYFHMMSKYWAINRTRFLIECVSRDGISRGLAKFYGYSKKRFAYIYGKKMMTLSPFKHDKEFKYIDLGNIEITGSPIIDFDKYEAKKQDSLKSLQVDEDEKKERKFEKRLKRHVSATSYFLRKFYSLADAQIVELGGNNVSRISLAEWIDIFEPEICKLSLRPIITKKMKVVS